MAEHGYRRTALEDVLGVPDEVVTKDRLHRTWDALRSAKESIERDLKARDLTASPAPRTLHAMPLIAQRLRKIIPKPRFSSVFARRRRVFCLGHITVLVGGFVLLGVVGCAVRRLDITTPSPVIEPWAEDGFNGRHIRTEHYEVYSTLGDASFEAALPGFLERAYEQWTAMLPASDPPSGKLNTYIFGNRSQWARFTRGRFPQRYEMYSRIQSGGFSEGTTSVSFYGNRAAALATLAHEGWHQYVASVLEEPIPAWLNEGLACYHESVEWIGRTPRFIPSRNTFRINSLREAVQLNRLLSLRDVLSADAGWAIGHDRREVAQTYYAQAWALAMFLRHGGNRRYAAAFDSMLDDLAAGSFHVRVSATRLTAANDGVAISPGEAAFRSYFAAPEVVEEDYQTHVRKLAGF